MLVLGAPQSPLSFQGTHRSLIHSLGFRATWEAFTLTWRETKGFFLEQRVYVYGGGEAGAQGGAGK